MKPWELYKYIKELHHTDYNESGKEVNWLIKSFPEEKTVRLIFEESRGKTDWLINFNFPVKPYKKQENTLFVTRGWAIAYKQVNDEIMSAFIDEINKPENAGFKIQICGWSYGGAMSLLAAEDFYYRTKIKPDVVTFGAPKPLFGRKTKKYVRSCINQYYQFRDKSDLVPYLPPFLGYTGIAKDKIDKFRFFGLFRPDIYHSQYIDENIYPDKYKETNV